MPLLAASTRTLRHVTARAIAITGARALASTTNSILPTASSTTDADKTADNSAAKDSSTESPKKKKHLIFGSRGPSLQDFLNASNLKTLDSSTKEELDNVTLDDTPYLSIKGRGLGAGAKYFIEVYGCQMNVNDTEILMSIMNSAGYVKSDNQSEADIVFLVTCAIRENAETKIWNRLTELKRRKLGIMKDRAPLVGVLGVSLH